MEIFCVTDFWVMDYFHGHGNFLCHRFLGYGLFSIVDYDTWKPRRQLYDPAFRKRYDI